MWWSVTSEDISKREFINVEFKCNTVLKSRNVIVPYQIKFGLGIISYNENSLSYSITMIKGMVKNDTVVVWQNQGLR